MNASRAYPSTRFHTFSTEPQVVSTITQPIPRSRSKSRIVTPNAGMITTSSGVTLREVELPVHAVMQELDAHLLELPVHMRIVDDLAHQQQPPVGKLVAGLVGVVDGAIHAVAEPELAGQPERQRTHLEGVIAGAEQVHEAAVIIGVPLLLDRALEPEALTEISAVHALTYTRIGRRRLGGRGCRR